MTNCKLYPERCKATNEYNKEKHKFEMDMVNQATQNKQPIEQTFKNRVKNEEWKNIYPINNHDFDYKVYTQNKYNPFTLGITNEPSMKGLIDGSLNLSNYVDAILENPTPDSSTIAGVQDVNNADPTVYSHLKKIKDAYSNMPLPYPDFKKDYPESKYPTEGQASSSYFIKSGHCKTKLDKATCQKKKFKWVDNPLDLNPQLDKFFSKTGNKPVKKLSGTCYKPKFIYINNIPKGKQNFKGMAPSLINDVMNISPEKLIPILSGYQVDGGGSIPCKEDYINSNLYSGINLLFLNVIILLLIIFIRYS